MKTISVGLTGLSRAGKTVFLTSAIHDLLECTGTELPEFRFQGVTYAGSAGSLPARATAFPYKQHLAALRGQPPRWPEPTSEVADYHVHLHLSRTPQSRSREGLMVFRDYPGERLVDVQLYGQEYEAWSAEVCQQMDVAPPGTQAAVQNFKACLDDLRLDTARKVPPARFEAVQRAYGAYCRASRDGQQLVAPVLPLLQARSMDAALQPPFFPVPKERLAQEPALRRQLRRAYDRYVKTAVVPFLKQIACCSHQMVLVDLLGVLRQGPERYTEVQEQIRQVLNCYQRIHSGWFPWLKSWLGGVRLQKVTFCATKADQATSDTRGHLEPLLKSMVLTAANHLALAPGFRRLLDYRVIAAHRSTEDVQTPYQGQQLIALRGRVQEGSAIKQVTVYPGRVPAAWPTQPEAWKDFRFPDFLPQALPVVAAGGQPIPHLHMDELLYALVEDLL